jgi:hypothetical protein
VRISGGSAIDAVVDWYGVADLACGLARIEVLRPWLQDGGVAGDIFNLVASPITYVRPGAPPFL